MYTDGGGMGDEEYLQPTPEQLEFLQKEQLEITSTACTIPKVKECSKLSGGGPVKIKVGSVLHENRKKRIRPADGHWFEYVVICVFGADIPTRVYGIYQEEIGRFAGVLTRGNGGFVTMEPARKALALFGEYEDTDDDIAKHYEKLPKDKYEEIDTDHMPTYPVKLILLHGCE